MTLNEEIIRSLFSIEISEPKKYANQLSTMRKGLSEFAAKRKEREYYVTVTVHDNRRSLNEKPKVFNLRNPAPQFLAVLYQHAYEMISLEEVKVVLLIKADNDIVEKTVKLKKVTINLIEYVAEMTNPIEKQVANLARELDIMEYSLDGKTFVKIAENE